MNNFTSRSNGQGLGAKLRSGNAVGGVWLTNPAGDLPVCADETAPRFGLSSGGSKSNAEHSGQFNFRRAN